MQGKNRRGKAQRGRRALRLGVLVAALGVLVPLAALAWRAGGAAGTVADVTVAIGPARYPPTATRVELPHGSIFTVERQGATFALMATVGDATHLLVATLPDGFGSETTDAVAALALSPDQRWLAIDGMSDHGDRVWVVGTTTGALRTVPDDALGNFVRWLPDGAHFLFRPFLPTRAAATTWNPGLWIVDAGSGTHVNLPLPGDLPATDLVDAAPLPDGASIILSVSAGLGQGSTVYDVTPDGLRATPLFHTAADVGLFAPAPDGRQIAYEALDDSTVPFRPAGLWTMAPDGSGQRQITLADGGHGYAPVWSPDGTRLAFVARLNAGDGTADGAAGRLVSAVQVARVADGHVTTVADPAMTHQPRNVDPTWAADGALLFTAMGASDGYGAALAPALLWRATPVGASFAGAHLAPLGVPGALGAVAVVP